MSFIKITYRNVGDGLLRGAEMTQRQLPHQRPPSIGDSPQNLEAGSTLHSLQSAQQVGQCPFQVTDLNLFQAARLASASSR